MTPLEIVLILCGIACIIASCFFIDRRTSSDSTDIGHIAEQVALTKVSEAGDQIIRLKDETIREAKEELDIDIDSDDIKCVHVTSNLASRTESFDFFFEVSKYTGTIRNCEGDKCADMQYFTLDEVAKLKNVVSTTRFSLAGLGRGEIYSECKSYRSAQGRIS